MKGSLPGRILVLLLCCLMAAGEFLHVFSHHAGSPDGKPEQMRTCLENGHAEEQILPDDCPVCSGILVFASAARGADPVLPPMLPDVLPEEGSSFHSDPAAVLPPVRGPPVFF